VNAHRLSILVVDDNRSSADALARILRKQGDEVEAVYDGETAIGRIRSAPPDVVLTDLKMEPVDGMAVLAAARSMRPPIETIVFTAYGAVDVAVRAMHLGARDFLTKPVTVEQVSTRLDHLRSERARGAPAVEVEPQADEFVAQAESSKALLVMLERAAAVPSPVWIEGEIGSGRMYCARTMHLLGPQRDQPLNVRNLTRDDPWPTAGTVLLPNVDDLPDDLQRELVRQLQHAPETVRLVATALPDGRRRVAEGQLRPELYYRLAVVVIPVPPLRRRPEDIVPLFRKGLRTYASRYKRPEPEISPRFRELLQRHYWPGNTRELLNLAERTVAMGDEGFNLEVIDDPGAGLPKLEPGFSLSDYLEGVERRILVEALRRSGGDRAAAGKLLGVERNTLRYKLNKYGLLDR
jgi:two-component system, NtrC family, response regulator HydG